MRISRFFAYKYQIPLFFPITTTGELKREGIIVCCYTQDNACGVGEVAPLPGLHVETLEKALKDIQHCCVELKNVECFSVNDILRLLDGRDICNSARFGIETACLQAFATEKRAPLQTLLFPDAQRQSWLPVCALIANPKTAILESQTAVAQGFRTLKLKVGKQDIAKDAEVLKSIRALVGPKVSLRIDANRAWTLDEAREFVSLTRKLKLDYIEEPLQNPQDLEKLSHFDMRLALDETLHDKRDWQNIENIHSIVLKPSLFAGYNEFLSAVKRAKNIGANCVLSASFESGINLSIISLLASSISPQISCGVGTFAWMKEDIINPPFRPFRGLINLQACVNALRHFDSTQNRLMST